MAMHAYVAWNPQADSFVEDKNGKPVVVERDSDTVPASLVTEDSQWAGKIHAVVAAHCRLAAELSTASFNAGSRHRISNYITDNLCRCVVPVAEKPHVATCRTRVAPAGAAE